MRNQLIRKKNQISDISDLYFFPVKVICVLKSPLNDQLPFERSEERSSRSDNTWLVRLSSERLVHCLLLLNCLFSIFNGQPGIMHTLSL